LFTGIRLYADDRLYDMLCLLHNNIVGLLPDIY